MCTYTISTLPPMKKYSFSSFWNALVDRSPFLNLLFDLARRFLKMKEERKNAISHFSQLHLLWSKTKCHSSARHMFLSIHHSFRLKDLYIILCLVIFRRKKISFVMPNEWDQILVAKKKLLSIFRIVFSLLLSWSLFMAIKNVSRERERKKKTLKMQPLQWIRNDAPD